MLFLSNKARQMSKFDSAVESKQMANSDVKISTSDKDTLLSGALINSADGRLISNDQYRRYASTLVADTVVFSCPENSGFS